MRSTVLGMRISYGLLSKHYLYIYNVLALIVYIYIYIYIYIVLVFTHGAQRLPMRDCFVRAFVRFVMFWSRWCWPAHGRLVCLGCMDKYTKLPLGFNIPHLTAI